MRARTSFLALALLVAVPNTAIAEVAICGSGPTHAPTDLALGVEELLEFALPETGSSQDGLYLLIRFPRTAQACPSFSEVHAVTRTGADSFSGTFYNTFHYPDPTRVGTVIEFEAMQIRDWILDLNDPLGRVHGGERFRPLASATYGTMQLMERLPPGATSLHPDFLPASWDTPQITSFPTFANTWVAYGPELRFGSKLRVADGYGDRPYRWE